MRMLAHSHKMPDGSKPEAKSSAQPPWQLFICSIDVEGLLFLPPQPPLHCQGDLGWELYSKRMQHKPSGICLCSGKRLLRAGTSQPSCRTQTLGPFLHPSPSSTPAIHPASTLHRQGCCNGDGETETFYEPIQFPSPNPHPSS